MTMTNAEAAEALNEWMCEPVWAGDGWSIYDWTSRLPTKALTLAISALEATGEPEAWDIVYRNRFTDNLTRDKEWAEKCAKRPDCTVTPLFTHPAPSVPAGWRLVPVEPTGAMCCAPFNHDDNRSSPAVRLTDDASNEAVAAFYRAMLAAAPEPDQ